jgi:Cof subfamily protein (haloacid dehalogenase superfamily)
MELVVFDLDGTLLNRDSRISDFTSKTLRLLRERNIAYTVATGRTRHHAHDILEGHSFKLPQAFKNGVMIWHPQTRQYSSGATLSPGELDIVLRACSDRDVTPFIFTFDDGDESVVYHPPLQSRVERELIRSLSLDAHTTARPLDELPPDAVVTHINSIGRDEAISSVSAIVNNEPHLVAYSGTAWEGEPWRWLDVHHSDATKGGAINAIRELLGLERVICFGDSDNDLSMFESADESYATANAKDSIKSVATAVIGHHDEEGVARFLRERFALDAA